ncbi:DUF317 domain-containing protein [Streptomyces sp. NPDC058471]|uniref:DUF317 domain-containing protein n=1 Tax=Streptomyces sp. NPDC058471 TaxID=3346516 RepID=UPI0036684E1D
MHSPTQQSWTRRPIRTSRSRMPTGARCTAKRASSRPTATPGSNTSSTAAPTTGPPPPPSATGTVWQARFGEHTPRRLITAFTTALADTHPVPRPDSPHSLPTLNPNLVTRRSTEVPAVLVASALEERVRSLAARHAVPTPAQRPARQAPSTNGRSR